jgi:hypothetical protein
MSTFNVNMRVLMSLLDLTDNWVYVLNGFSMTISYFIFRIVLISWILVSKLSWQPFVGLLTGVYWDQYPNQDGVIYGKIAMFNFMLIGILNYFWFYKIFKGLIKAITKLT